MRRICLSIAVLSLNISTGCKEEGVDLTAGGDNSETGISAGSTGTENTDDDGVEDSTASDGDNSATGDGDGDG
ncbi:MAG: hypothetical protein ACPHRO_06075, partial [Nannocystaceae bacterium]